MVMDNQAPYIGPVDNGGYTNDTAPQIQGTLSAPLEANETLRVFRDGIDIGAATVTGTNWIFSNPDVLADGLSYQYTAKVIDAAGNEGGISNTYMINIDTSAPRSPQSGMTSCHRPARSITAA
jgi:hypothetical protein